MEYLLPLGAIWLANLLGAMSPGPAFVVVARAAAEKSRRGNARAKSRLDRAMAGFLGLIGAKLLLDAR